MHYPHQEPTSKLRRLRGGSHGPKKWRCGSDREQYAEGSLVTEGEFRKSGACAMSTSILLMGNDDSHPGLSKTIDRMGLKVPEIIPGDWGMVESGWLA
jgi:hypothetical protein